jgi:hypothetical protein
LGNVVALDLLTMPVTSTHGHMPRSLRFTVSLAAVSARIDAALQVFRGY